jgi:hypothetical protein
MRRWTESEYRELFREHPPTDARCPAAGECTALGSSLNRTSGAIRSQWNDGRSAVLGQRSAASGGLRDYLVRRGWL